MSSLPELDVVAGVIWRHGRFLAARRPEGRPLAGWWEFPGGKVEPGESPHEALVRELGEELGLGGVEGRFWRLVERDEPGRGLTLRLHFFHVLRFSGEPCPREGQLTAWVSPEEARELAFLPADASVLEALRQPEEQAPEGACAFL